MFIKIKFNALPPLDIIAFLESIIKAENLNYTTEQIQHVQAMYGADIRSMINYIQMNQDNCGLNIIHVDVWKHLLATIQSGENINVLVSAVYGLSNTYNMDIKTILKEFVYYVWTTDPPSTSISELEIAFHNNHASIDHMIRYIIIKLI